MIRINRPLVVPSYLNTKRIEEQVKVMSDFYSVPQNKRRQRKFEMNWQVIQDMKHDMAHVFNSKCAFCESALDSFAYFEVVHFRPPSGTKGFKDFSEDHYWWLSFEWQNLYIACESCSRFKQTM